MTLKPTKFKNGDWVVLKKDLEKNDTVENCPIYCVTHTEKSHRYKVERDIVFAEKVALDLDLTHPKEARIFDYAENFTATGKRDQDITVERHMKVMSHIFESLTNKEHDELEKRYRDFLYERKAFYDDELKFTPTDYSWAQTARK